MIDPATPMEDVRKKYRRLSILVHPDKNPGDPERAQAAFDAVKKAYEVLDDEETRKRCYELVEEAEGRTKINMEEKRKALRKQGKPQVVDEDDPEKYKQAVKILLMKLFADLERKRRTMEQKVSEDAARKREAELAAEERRNMEKEFNKNWEESRQGRVNSWLSFQKGGGKPEGGWPPGTKLEPEEGAGVSAEGPSASASAGGKEKKKKKEKKDKKKFSPMGFRPPKHKPESR